MSEFERCPEPETPDEYLLAIFDRQYQARRSAGLNVAAVMGPLIEISADKLPTQGSDPTLSGPSEIPVDTWSIPDEATLNTMMSPTVQDPSHTWGAILND